MLRRDELSKSIFIKDQKRITEYLSRKKLTNLENKLKKKNQRIKELSKLVIMQQEGTSVGQLINTPSESDSSEEENKMTRAEFLMAQVDLEPIESQGS